MRKKRVWREAEATEPGLQVRLREDQSGALRQLGEGQWVRIKLTDQPSEEVGTAYKTSREANNATNPPSLSLPKRPGIFRRQVFLAQGEGVSDDPVDVKVIVTGELGFQAAFMVVDGEGPKMQLKPPAVEGQAEGDDGEGVLDRVVEATDPDDVDEANLNRGLRRRLRAEDLASADEAFYADER